ncbi:hypothetical protein BH24BAC1_BH24BAC1_18060 [soil metagenome]|jgi:putative toxin-antitoxin system antitoxin component (TIGR02293 family)
MEENKIEFFDGITKEDFEQILSKYRGSIENRNELVKEARKGVEPEAFLAVAALSGYRKQQIAEILDVSLKTMMRYKQEQKKLNPGNSELILKLIGLFKKGEELFGDLHSFKRWLEYPAYGLGNQVPYNLLNLSTGIDLILDELSRIEHGDLA